MDKESEQALARIFDNILCPLAINFVEGIKNGIVAPSATFGPDDAFNIGELTACKGFWSSRAVITVVWMEAVLRAFDAMNESADPEMKLPTPRRHRLAHHAADQYLRQFWDRLQQHAVEHAWQIDEQQAAHIDAVYQKRMDAYLTKVVLNNLERFVGTEAAAAIKAGLDSDEVEVSVRRIDVDDIRSGKEADLPREVVAAILQDEAVTVAQEIPKDSFTVPGPQSLQ